MSNNQDNGNAAMREALVLIANTTECLEASLKRDNVWDGHIQAVCNIIEVARHALAKPPRNCDLFDTKDECREAFQKLRGHCVWADVSLWDNRDEIEAFLDWLFATKKGETDGSK